MPSDMPAVFPMQLGKRMADVVLLTSSSIFAAVGPQGLGVLLDAMDLRDEPPGALLQAGRGQPAHLAVVLDGTACAVSPSGALGVLRRGDHFGEAALFGGVAGASVTAQTAVRLATLQRTRFESLARAHPGVALPLMTSLAASLAAALEQPPCRSRSVDTGGGHAPRALVRACVSGVRVDAPAGMAVGALLPVRIDGALVVAAALDAEPVALGTPLTFDARLEPISVEGWEGRRIYRTSAALMLLEATRRAAVGLVPSMGPREGERQLVLFDKTLPTATQREAIAAAMRALSADATPLREETWSVQEARARFAERGADDAAALLAFHRDKTTTLLSCGGTLALALGPVLPNARLVTGLSLHEHPAGLALGFGDELRPSHGEPTAALPAMVPPCAPVTRAASSRAMSRELAAWLRAMGIRNVGDFNRSCVTGQVEELVFASEGFHEKHIGLIADRIGAKNARVVAIAGPSSSGKSTFTRRLVVQLEVNGIVPVHLSLDDYYVDRERTPRDARGELDFESARALDVPLLTSHVTALLAGERVKTARFDFPSGRSLPAGGPELELGSSRVLLVEGLHALDPAVLGPAAPAAFKVFVHPETALSFDRLTALLPDDVRVLRRIVRDRHQRGYSASESVRRWPSVRRGEEAHVLPWAAQADVVFDSSLVYELAVLRVYAERYLLEIGRDDPAFPTAQRLRRLADPFVPIHPDHVPPNSILREFIGGSGFDA